MFNVMCGNIYTKLGYSWILPHILKCWIRPDTDPDRIRQIHPDIWLDPDLDMEPVHSYLCLAEIHRNYGQMLVSSFYKLH